MCVYKRVHQLVNDDLREHPVWQFLTEQEEKYDEDYLKPMSNTTGVNPKSGIFVVQTSFQMNDGSLYEGYCYATDDQDLSYIQPVIIRSKKQISFWFGMYKPDKSDLTKVGKVFKKEISNIFPILFSSTVKVNNKKFEGCISGLLYLDSRDHVKSIIP